MAQSATPARPAKRKSLTPHFPGSNGKIPRLIPAPSPGSPLTASKVPQTQLLARDSNASRTPKTQLLARPLTASRGRPAKNHRHSQSSSQTHHPQQAGGIRKFLTPRYSAATIAANPTLASLQQRFSSSITQAKLGAIPRQNDRPAPAPQQPVASSIAKGTTKAVAYVISSSTSSTTESDSDEEAADAFTGVSPPNTTNIDPRLTTRAGGRHDDDDDDNDDDDDDDDDEDDGDEAEEESDNGKEESQDSLIHTPIIVRR